MGFAVYMLTNRPYGVLYTGVTNNLVRRIHEHRTDAVSGFSQRYRLHTLVWFDLAESPVAAIEREKQIKEWKRRWKIRLIEQSNPQWQDLYESIL